MIRTHIRIAHIASIRTGSPVDSRQCDWGIRHAMFTKVHARLCSFMHGDIVFVMQTSELICGE